MIRITVGSKEGGAAIRLQQSGPRTLPRGFLLTSCSAVTRKPRCVLRQAATWMALENITLSEKPTQQTTQHMISKTGKSIPTEVDSESPRSVEGREGLLTGLLSGMMKIF